MMSITSTLMHSCPKGPKHLTEGGARFAVVQKRRPVGVGVTHQRAFACRACGQAEPGDDSVPPMVAHLENQIQAMWLMGDARWSALLGS